MKNAMLGCPEGTSSPTGSREGGEKKEMEPWKLRSGGKKKELARKLGDLWFKKKMDS